jgi:hypothetical protein
MNHLTEEQFVLYYYGEGDGSPAVRAHLDACEACRAEYASLQRVLNVVDSAPVPERDANYGTQVWSRLQPSLRWDRPRGLSWWPLSWWPAPRWAAAALVATLVVAAFLAGRHYPKAQSGAQTANAGQVRERILLVAVGDHLERSQTVLLELVNARPGESLDVASERERAGDLVAENRLYRQTAARTGDTRVASVLDDLEPVLLEIAHGPDRLTPEEVENLRQRIEGDGILFKVRVVGSTVRHREEKAAPAPDRAKPAKAPYRKNKMSKLRFLIIVASALAPAGLALGQTLEAPQSESFFQKPATKPSDDDRLLQKAKAALDAARWDEALAAFSAVASEKGAHADEALYWKAYALNKIARRAEALTALAQLRKAYANSRWQDDARALEIEVRQASGEKGQPQFRTG